MFVQLTCNEKENIITLYDAAATWHDFIHIGYQYEFTGLKRAKLYDKSDSDVAFNVYKGTEVSIRLLDIHPSLISYQNMILSIDSNEMLLNYVTFDSIVNRDIRLHQYVNIMGSVHEFHGNGWIDMKSDIYENNNIIHSVFESCQYLRLYVVYHRHTPLFSSLRRGTVIKIYSVLPVLLRGIVCGFAVTARSHITISKFAPSEATDRCHTRLKPSPVQRESCVMYTAWLAEVTANLSSILVSKDRNTISYGHKPDQELVEITLSAMTSTIKQSLFSIPDRNAKREFLDPEYAPLFTVRAGHDADWLSSQLPMVSPATLLCQYT